ncbi:VWA domain-containing protein [Thalassotalea fonticola]|uniref:VWA domain-containing protein n=1 Tax=Thalassotalea fonticola TaxID=3065649 RepID=A0ABZ0GSJ5_9GAMM|nr:VWA domain-containing protein [Colwelliaceae bacterium S1-1]
MPDLLLNVIDNLALHQLADFHFIRPWWLLAIIPLYLFMRFVVKSEDSLSQWQDHMSDTMIYHLAIKEQQKRRLTPKKLFMLFAVLITLVMAGPTWQQQPTPFFTDESVLIIGLDVSASMNSSDVQPSRLLRAKQKVNEVLQKRGDAKTALIAFAGSAHVAMPITQDKEMIRHFLDVLDSSIMPASGKVPQSVLPAAETLLAQVKAPSSILLLTDQTNQLAVNGFKNLLTGTPHQMVVWAIGENPDSGLASSTGLSASDLSLLEELANAGNGNMVPFTHNSDDVEMVLRSLNNTLQNVDDNSLPWFDAGYLLLFLLIPLQALWFRKGWTMQW